VRAVSRGGKQTIPDGFTVVAGSPGDQGGSLEVGRLDLGKAEQASSAAA
jgi:hypothetical protein